MPIHSIVLTTFFPRSSLAYDIVPSRYCPEEEPFGNLRKKEHVLLKFKKSKRPRRKNLYEVFHSNYYSAKGKIKMPKIKLRKGDSNFGPFLHGISVVLLPI